MDPTSRNECSPWRMQSATELAGFGIMKYQDTDAHLMLFAVAPEFRRRGIGNALMDWLETSAITAGIELIWLEAESARPTPQRSRSTAHAVIGRSIACIATILAWKTRCGSAKT